MYYIIVSNADAGYKKTFNTTKTQNTIKGLEADTEYTIKLRVGYNNETEFTKSGESVVCKTSKDDQLRAGLSLNANGRDIDVTIVNYVEGVTYYVYRKNPETGKNELVATTTKSSVAVEAIVGKNTMYVKEGVGFSNTAKVSITFDKTDVKLVITAQKDIGSAHLHVTSVAKIKQVWYYRVVNGKKQLVKDTKKVYYTADAYAGENIYTAKAEVVFADGTTAVVDSNNTSVTLEQSAFEYSCVKTDNDIKITVTTDLNITEYWVIRVRDGKSTMVAISSKETITIPASYGTAFKVTACIVVAEGDERYLTSQVITLE